MNSLDDYLIRYVSKTGLVREKVSQKILLDLKSVNIFVIFGELSQTVFFAKTVYDYEVAVEDSYNIVITWPGLKSFFYKADEVWSFASTHAFDELYNKSDGIINNAKFISVLSRSLNEVFLNVKHAYEYQKWFYNFIQDDFITKYNQINVNYPQILSKIVLPQIFLDRFNKLQQSKVFMMPFKKSVSFQYNKNHSINHYESLYITLIKSLVSRGISVVCVSNDFTFDLSKSFDHPDVVFIKENDFGKIITMCHMTGNYLDYFGNSYFVGALAQSNCFNVMERNSWFESKKIQEYEILHSGQKNKNYFSFLNFNNPDDYTLNTFYFDNIITCLRDFIEDKNSQEPRVVIKQKNVNFEKIVKLTRPKFFGKLFNIKGQKNAKSECKS